MSGPFFSGLLGCTARRSRLLLAHQAKDLHNQARTVAEQVTEVEKSRSEEAWPTRDRKVLRQGDFVQPVLGPL